MKTLRIALALPIVLVATTAAARVLSYAPLTDQVSTPAMQHRLNRNVVLIEGLPNFAIPLGAPLPVGGFTGLGQLVVYDSLGEREPRVVLPSNGQTANFYRAAARESGSQLFLLAMTDASIGNATSKLQWVFSNDGGTTWSVLPLPAVQSYDYSMTDIGGPIAKNRNSSIRIGSADRPFVVAVGNNGADQAAVYSVGQNGAVTTLWKSSKAAPYYGSAPRLLGSNLSGTRFLFQDPDGVTSILDFDGHLTPIDTKLSTLAEGWITADGSAYILDNNVLALYRNGSRTEIAGVSYPGATGPAPINLSVIAVPTFDYDGAWVVQRLPSVPATILSRHLAGGALTEMWRDITAPEVEALHAGSSGQRLLIQVHRQHPQADQRIFKDPALAVWTVGEPAPRQYDELFLNEMDTKGFVHVDPETIASGADFIFDSGVNQNYYPGPVLSPPSSGGGSDVIQEWGVVRSSLQQRLVLPGVARLPGAYGSFWMTDLIIRNSDSAPVHAQLRFVPTGSSDQSSETRQTTIPIGPQQTLVLNDALKSLFGFETAGGALFITPDVGKALTVTSRTYSKAEHGTYGFGLMAVDVYAAASPRFPVTFSGALQGPNTRTNVITTDVSQRGSLVSIAAEGNSGAMGRSDFAVSAPSAGTSQINHVTDPLGVGDYETGALIFQPKSGAAIGSVIAIDNRTNDPTYFTPDLPPSALRTIPAIGHIDGANGSKFRSDLFLHNSASQPRTVTLQATPWDNPSLSSTLNLTLLPHEAKVIRDVLFTAFGKTGIARLRFTSPSDGVRLTSRTYTIADNGGTYGFVMPPLNNFQQAGSGEALEIIGARGESNFRTNLALVDLTSFPGPNPSSVRVEIEDDKGARVDSFEILVPSAGGIQLVDLFRSRGLGDGPHAAMIRVSPLGGMIGAFATLIDNETNDPIYLAPQLAARQ
jgi:hypothetical protein